MDASVAWNCEYCKDVNVTELSTRDATPHNLVCGKCGQAQHVRLTLQNFVHERIGPPAPAKEEAQHGT